MPCPDTQSSKIFSSSAAGGEVPGTWLAAARHTEGEQMQRPYGLCKPFCRSLGSCSLLRRCIEKERSCYKQEQVIPSTCTALIPSPHRFSRPVLLKPPIVVNASAGDKNTSLRSSLHMLRTAYTGIVQSTWSNDNPTST